MSDHVRDGRGPDRREHGRREVDRTTHVLEQGVIAAALRWRRAQEDAASIHSAEAVGERIAAARNLGRAVDDYEQHAGADETGAADLVDVIGMAIVAAAVVIPSSLVDPGWARYVLVMVGVIACAVLLVRGERRRS